MELSQCIFNSSIIKKGIKYIQKWFDEWADVADELYGFNDSDHIGGFMFGGFWAGIDNTAVGAAKRIIFFLTTQFNPAFYCSEFKTSCYEHLTIEDCPSIEDYQ